MIARLPAPVSAGLNKEILVASGVVAYHETKWRELKVYDDVYEILRWLDERDDLVRGIISAGLGIKQADCIAADPNLTLLDVKRSSPPKI